MRNHHTALSFLLLQACNTSGCVGQSTACKADIMQLGTHLSVMQFSGYSSVAGRCCVSVLMEMLALLVVYFQEAADVCSHLDVIDLQE